MPNSRGVMISLNYPNYVAFHYKQLSFCSSLQFCKVCFTLKLISINMATSTIPANQIDGADFSYKDEPDETLTTEVRELFENYSKIPSSEVVPHIKDLVFVPTNIQITRLTSLNSVTKHGLSSPTPALAFSTSSIFP